MSNERGKPWYKSPPWLGLIVATFGVVTTIMIFICSSPPVDFSVYLNPMEASVQQGGFLTQPTVTVKGIHGYKHQVRLSASGQSSDMIITFNPQIERPTPEYHSAVTISVSRDIPIGDYAIKIKGTGADGKEHTCTYILTVKPKPSMTPSDTFTLKKVVNVSDAFAPGGWMGDSGDITLEDACTDNPHSAPACIKVSYSAACSQGKKWAGIYWQYPDKNWGNMPEGRDLTGATRLTFWAKGEKGGEKAEFKVGGITGRYPDSIQPPVGTGIVILSDAWQQYVIDLAGKDLRHIIGGFCWVTNKNQNPHGCHIYLDDIEYDP